jgi:hypothetical protein
MSLEQRYLKYKSKYLELKEQKGGECDIIPEHRITINNNCYEIEDIYKWTIDMNKSKDPLRNPISQIDRNRIIDSYNNLPLTLEEEQEFINKIINGTFIYDNASEKVRQNKSVTLAAVLKNGLSLQYASSILRADKEVVRASNEALASVEVSTSRIGCS